MSITSDELYKQYELLCESITEDDRLPTEGRILADGKLSSVQQFHLLNLLNSRWPRPPKKPVPGWKPHEPPPEHINDHSDFVRRHLPSGGGEE